MKTLPVQFSGRSGEWVYYVRGNKQCRRRYVVPRDPRTPKQLRARAALAAASRRWSHSEEFTDPQRDAWDAAAARVQSRPRLGQSGPLTAQQYFVGCQCRKTAPGQRPAGSTWEPRRGITGPPRGLRHRLPSLKQVRPRVRSIGASPRPGVTGEGGCRLPGCLGAHPRWGARSPGGAPARFPCGARAVLRAHPPGKGGRGLRPHYCTRHTQTLDGRRGDAAVESDRFAGP